jgi:hypothetical protein
MCSNAASAANINAAVIIASSYSNSPAAPLPESPTGGVMPR